MISTLKHPGTPPSKRWAALPCSAEPVDLVLPVTETLAKSVAMALADFDGGWLEIEDAALANLDFVVPGHDPTGAHAAWYAGPHQMGAGRVHHLGLHAARKEGGAWLHGHGEFAALNWSGPTFGHVLPFETRLAQPIRARGWGTKGARFEVQNDPETHFPLNQPVACGVGSGAALITLRPNQDLGAALCAAAADVGITKGHVHGLGSIVNPKLIDQPRIDSYATEILFTQGRIENGQARLEAEIVTLSGSLHKGWLEPDENGVCITAELLLIAD